MSCGLGKCRANGDGYIVCAHESVNIAHIVRDLHIAMTMTIEMVINLNVAPMFNNLISFEDAEIAMIGNI